MDSLMMRTAAQTAVLPTADCGVTALPVVLAVPAIACAMCGHQYDRRSAPNSARPITLIATISVTRRVRRSKSQYQQYRA